MRSAIFSSPLLAAGLLLVASCEQEKSSRKKTPNKADKRLATDSNKEKDKTGKEKKPEAPRLSPTLDLLPAGSTLNDIFIPRYDEKMRRAALLQAGLLEVISEDHVTAENVELRVFNSDQKESVRVHMGAAEYFRENALLEAKEILTINGDGFRTRGSAALFHLDTRQGYIPGRVYTSFLPKPKAEKKKEETKPGAKPLEIPTPSPVPVPETPEEVPVDFTPVALTPEELNKISLLLKPEGRSILADAASTRELMTRSGQLGQTADVAFRNFATLADRPDLIGSTSHSLEHPRPFLDPAKEAIRVTAQGGMYIDANRGMIIYERDIEVIEPRFTLTASKQLRVFLEPEEAPKGGKSSQGEKPPKEEKAPEVLESFSSVETILATGGVRVVRPDPKGKRPPLIATADSAIFDALTGDILLQGGFPTIRQGESFLKAGEAGLYLRFYENGNFFAEKGIWTTAADLAKLREKEKDQKKPGTAATNDPRKQPVANDKDAAKGEVAAKDQGALKPKEPEIIKVSCKGGMFFDAIKGQIVYLDDIEVIDPAFKMTCPGELKIHLKKKEGAEEDGLNGPEAFSEVQTIVATGGVTVVREDPEGKREPVVATAETAIYDAKTGDVILRGGTPTIRQGSASIQAGSPDLYLRFYQSGDFYAEEGKWTTIGDLANLRKKPGEKPKPQQLIKVTCEGGLSFDTTQGQIVYREKIEVLEPRFRMNCGQEMKIYLTRKANAEKDQLEGPEAFADVKAIVAIGGVKVVRKDPKGQRAPVVATSDTATYDAPTGDIILRGGFPKIQQGPNSLRAGEKGLYLRFYANGNFFANRGKWIQEGDIKDLQKKDE